MRPSSDGEKKRQASRTPPPCPLAVVVVVVVMMMLAMVIGVEAVGGRGERRRWSHHSQNGMGERMRVEERLLRVLKDLLTVERTDKAFAGENNNNINDDSSDDMKSSSVHPHNYSSEEAGRRWMETTNRQLLHWLHEEAKADWDFSTNITEATQKKYLSTVVKSKQWAKSRITEARKFRTDHFDPDLRRQFLLFTMSDTPKDPAKLRRRTQLKTDMMSTYSTAKVCLKASEPRSKQQLSSDRTSAECLPLNPDLRTKMAESRDPEELLEVWEGWREVSGKPQRQRYQQFVQLLNEGARDNGFSDYSEAWTKQQFKEDIDLDAMVLGLWNELRPLYLELHAYVRGRLRHYYGAAVVGEDGTIPAHLLGNMWAQSWENIFPLVTPYPEGQSQASRDLDQALKAKVGRRGVRGLFELSERFYSSMGLPRMTDKFWTRSMLEKPPDHEVQCHASAADLFSPGDFRIEMCTSINMEDLGTVHHEMGHVQYFMAYAGQPTIFRNAPNQGFHEAVGDTTTLAAMSPTHLTSLGLAPLQGRNQTEANLNSLMRMGLVKIAVIPFTLLVDRWRWRVFRGQTTNLTYNYDWWKLRLDLQGLRSPVPRSEEDFDAAAKMHVASNSPYICYFVSHVLQFQFYQALCQASGHSGSLHLCDFGGSLKAGILFKNFLAKGASRPWQETLEKFTGSRHISAQALLEYFQPLLEWLKRQNEESGESVGWNNAKMNWI